MAAQPKIIEGGGICDGCGVHNEFLQEVSGSPVVGAALCRGCLETEVEPNQKSK